MVNFSRYFGINYSAICCIHWIFWLTEAEILSLKAGSAVNLTCSNNSIDSVNVLSWKMNGERLFDYKHGNKSNLIRHNKTTRLDLKMTTSEHQLYALIINNIQKSHEGNYSCETTTDSGLFEKKWELLITEEAESLSKFPIVVLVTVPCSCLLIIISVLMILRCVQRRKRANNLHPTSIRQQPRDEIYENHLEIQRQAQIYAMKH